MEVVSASQTLLMTSVTNVLMDTLGFQIVKVSGSYFQYFILFLIKQIILRLQLSKPGIKKFDMRQKRWKVPLQSIHCW